ncbi:hypothetical protein ASG87_13030 [Frateuria sp. Soil773]|uniref:OmpA family protein n=1 Tax=Frateuria sp. Soil773 TaxID=1736407 RepID=UPI0006F6A8FA|nr:OmpA family protein [Frateuria sp. Soil773]KRE99912.1 hypothetical protein ASG87_13030 [Frateuria sp. Soil773]
MKIALGKTILLSLGMAGLAACANVSRGIAADGRGADELRWPAPEDTTPMHRDGTWPTLASVRQVQAGQSKDQVRALIGAPHFSEGVFGVREWNYLFHLRDGQAGTATVCQFKVLFDEHRLAQSFHWKPETCAALLEPPAPAAPVAPAPAAGVERRSLSADALFAFDRSGLADIRPEGRLQLDRLARELQSREAGGTIAVIGHADRLGSADYNQALSQRRADTVRAYLVDKGVAADAITAEGRGSSEPVAECGMTARAALIACLAPDRRVEIVVGPRS